MSNFSIEIQGFNRVENKLRTLAAKLPKMSSDVVYRWAQGTRAILKSTPYPPKRPNQKYIRTGKLANSWAAARTNTGATIWNKAGYSRYVVGDTKGGGQAWMHENRWWRARQDVIDKEVKELTKELAQAIEKEWRK